MTTVELLKSIRSLVAYHQSCGLHHYHRSAELTAGLHVLERVAGEAGDQEISTDTRAGTGAPREPAASVVPGVSLAELAEEISGCRLCNLWTTRTVTTPGRGGLRPRLLVVGDWLVEGAGAIRGALFGDQQDQMLTRMIEAIELQPSEVFITNLIKCSVPGTVTPEASHIATCLGYLKQQIALLSPRVILAMGSGAAQTLIGSARPLIALRGRFHQFRAGSAQPIALMPTFHPTYLLKNPEMKQPTWNDLQAVKKKLGED